MKSLKGGGAEPIGGSTCWWSGLGAEVTTFTLHNAVTTCLDSKVDALVIWVGLHYQQYAVIFYRGLRNWSTTFICWCIEASQKICGVLQRLQAFILFKTTDSTNHVFDWTNLPGSGGGIISSVKWFSRHSTPELWNKTNQENYHFDFDQSAGAELWISKDETPGANQDCGINHIIRMVRKVTHW